MHRIITVTGLDIEMAASPELLLLHRAEGLASFVDLVAGFADAEGDACVGAFLAWLAMAARFDQVPELDRPPSPDAVQLMTVHRSKGLEWPVVVLPSLTAKVFPPLRGIARWTSTPHAVPYPIRGDAESLPVLVGLSPKEHKAFVADCKTHDAHEELRLVYVAVTRAKRLVIASGSWWGPSQKSPRGPSPYLVSRCATRRSPAPARSTRGPRRRATTTPTRCSATSTRSRGRLQPDADVRERRAAAAAAVREHVGLDVDGLRAEHAALGRRRAAPSPLLGLDAADLELVRGWDDDIALILEERRAERSATRTVALPTSLSASDLVRLAADPELFTQRLARPMPSAPAPAARRGTRFHAWVEQHFGARARCSSPTTSPVRPTPSIDSDDALESMQEAFLRSAYADRVPGRDRGAVHPRAGRARRAGPHRRGVRLGRRRRPRAHRGRRLEDLDQARLRPAAALDLPRGLRRAAGLPLEQVDAAFVYVRDGAVVRPDTLLTRAELESPPRSRSLTVGPSVASPRATGAGRGDHGVREDHLRARAVPPHRAALLRDGRASTTGPGWVPIPTFEDDVAAGRRAGLAGSSTRTATQRCATSCGRAPTPSCGCAYSRPVVDQPRWCGARSPAPGTEEPMFNGNTEYVPRRGSTPSTRSSGRCGAYASRRDDMLARFADPAYAHVRKATVADTATPRSATGLDPRRRTRRTLRAAWTRQRARRMSSTRSLASPKSIAVLSRKNSGFCTPA